MAAVRRGLQGAIASETLFVLALPMCLLCLTFPKIVFTDAA
jgi:hypothetical protein